MGWMTELHSSAVAGRGERPHLSRQLSSSARQRCHPETLGVAGAGLKAGACEIGIAHGVNFVTYQLSTEIPSSHGHPQV